MEGIKASEGFEYDVFISYRHSEPDITIAKKLMESLEGYRAPHSIAQKSGIKRVGRVFRDREELPTTTDLSESIMNALVHSRFLIVVCSLRTPESKWIGKEIEVFKEHHGSGNLQALLIEGEPDESFPESLNFDRVTIKTEDGNTAKQVKELELLAADIRPDELKGRNRLQYGKSPAVDRKLLSKSLKLLKTERLRCLAPIFCCKFDELYQRHFRRTVRNIITVSSAAVLILASFGFYAANMNTQLRAQTQIAMQQKDSALKSQSLFLSDLSRQQLEKGDRIAAVMLALEAMPKDSERKERPYVFEAEAALRHAVTMGLNDSYKTSTIIRARFTSFSHDGKRMLSANYEDRITMWDVQSGKMIKSFKLDDTIFEAYKKDYPDSTKSIAAIWAFRPGSAEFSPDGSKILLSNTISTVLLDAETGRETVIAFRPGGFGIYPTFSPDGSKIFAAKNDKELAVFDSNTGIELFKLVHTRDMYGYILSSNGSKVITRLQDEIKIWDASTGKELVALKEKSISNATSFNADGSRIITGAYQKKVWDATTGELLFALTTDDEYSNPVVAKFNFDGSRIITYRNKDKTPRMLDSASGKELFLLEGHTGNITALGFSPDGRKVITASDDKTARIWDTATGREIIRLNGSHGIIDRAAFSPDNSQIVTITDKDRTIRIFSAETGIELEKLEDDSVSGNSSSLYYSHAFSHDGSKLAISVGGAAGQKTIIFDKTASNDFVMIGTSSKDIYNSAFSPDVSKCITKSKDKDTTQNTIILSDAKNGRELFKLDGLHTDIDKDNFSPDSSKVFIHNEVYKMNTVDVTTGKELSVFENANYDFANAVFSPDGSKAIPHYYFENITLGLYDTASGKEIARLKGHSGQVNSVAFSPDGSKIATCSSDRTARIWDTATGLELKKLEGHSEFVHFAVFSPDGSKVVTAPVKNAAVVWDVSTGKQISVLTGHTSGISAGGFSPDGRKVVTGSNDGNVRVWDVSSGREVINFNCGGYAGKAFFSPDGSKIITSQNDKDKTYVETVKIWDAVSGMKLTELEGSIKSISPDYKRAVTSVRDDRYKEKCSYLWDMAAGKKIMEFDKRVNTAIFSSDSSKVITASFNTDIRTDTVLINTFDAAAGKELSGKEIHYNGCVQSAQFSPDGSRVSVNYFQDTLYILDAASGKKSAEIDVNYRTFERAIFIRDGSKVITFGDGDGEIWDAASGKKIAAMTGNFERDAFMKVVNVLSPDRDKIITISGNDAGIWDTATGREIVKLTGHSKRIGAAAFSPDGSKVITSSQDKTARLWDAATGKELKVFNCNADDVKNVFFSPDGSMAVIGDTPGKRIWDLSSGKEVLLNRSGIYNIVFCPANKKAAVSFSDSTSIYGLSTGRELARVEGNGASFSKDGSMFATSDRTLIRLWDTAAIKELDKIKCSGDVSSVSFSPEGQGLIIHMGNNIYKWEVEPLKKIMSKAKERLNGRELTDEEKSRYFLQ